MGKSTTDRLDEVLASSRPEDLAQYLAEQEEALVPEGKAFTSYMRGKFSEKNLSQRDIFLSADIPQRFGYKLISGEKHTLQRDLILRICLAAHFTIGEVQDALRLYGMAPLYSRNRRDAAVIIAFNSGMEDPAKLNALLTENGMEPLWKCGEQD